MFATVLVEYLSSGRLLSQAGAAELLGSASIASFTPENVLLTLNSQESREYKNFDSSRGLSTCLDHFVQ